MEWVAVYRRGQPSGTRVRLEDGPLWPGQPLLDRPEPSTPIWPAGAEEPDRHTGAIDEEDADR